MIHQLVEEIENDDFHRITAPLYGRGFVKLFAECVDEDPAPLMQEFTEIYSGLRRPGVRTRPVQTPVESPDVAEPKDRNAPPPRPKIRHVIVADDPEDKPEIAAPVEAPKDAVSDAPKAGPSGPAASEPAESLKAEVESPADAAAPEQVASRKSPVEVPSKPAESPKAEVESPSDTDEDAPTARPSGRSEETSLPAASEPVESPKAIGAGILPAADGDGAVATQGADLPGDSGDLPAADGDGAVATQGEGPASSGPNGQPDKPANQSTDEPTNRRTDEPANQSTDEPADDESLLGELFDLVARKRSERSDEPSTDKHEAKDESSVKISLPASSWDDAPLEEEGDFWQKLHSLDKWKYWKIGAALAGLFLLSVIVSSVVINRRAKPNDGTDTPAVTQAEPIPVAVHEPAPKPALETQATRSAEPETRSAEPETRNAEPETRNAEPETPSAEAATTASPDGRTVYTANLIPPPDSYVE